MFGAEFMVRMQRLFALLQVGLVLFVNRVDEFLGCVVIGSSSRVGSLWWLNLPLRIHWDDVTQFVARPQYVRPRTGPRWLPNVRPATPTQHTPYMLHRLVPVSPPFPSSYIHHVC